jgi:hypothetical protein
MTEAEWLTANDPIAMLASLFGPFERLDGCFEEVCFSRKNLLLVCACFYRLGDLITPALRCWPDHAAQAADGCYEKSALHGEGEEADEEFFYVLEHTTEEGKGRLQALNELWSWIDRPDDGSNTFKMDERKEQTTLIRDIFGNPFRPININPSWLTSTVLALAHQMYDSRDFSPMPILADALQDAGCDNEEVLKHCRGPGPHIRGCFVLDLLLGKD